MDLHPHGFLQIKPQACDHITPNGKTVNPVSNHSEIADKINNKIRSSRIRNTEINGY